MIDVRPRELFRRQPRIAGVAGGVIALVAALGAGSLLGFRALPDWSGTSDGEPGPRLVVTGGERWRTVGWAPRGAPDEPACMALRVDDQEVSGQCGYRTTPDRPGYSPSAGPIPGGGQVVFGPVPANTATAVLALPNGQRRPVPTVAVPGLPGRFFAAAVEPAPSDVPVRLLDGAGRELAV